MTVQQPEWASLSFSEEQAGGHDQSHFRVPDELARPETPITRQSPDFPPSHELADPDALRTPPRDNARYLSQTTVSPTMQRRRSSSSYSNTSIITNHLPTSLSNIQPAPAYVGPFGATQIVSEHQAGLDQPSKSDIDGNEHDDEDVNGDVPVSSKSEVSFSPPALTLLNGFLDQLLFSFLAHARSTSLAELRLAVNEVLRSRLAGEAIASAEEELQELLGDGAEEDGERLGSAKEENSWDLELVWRRTRLRVMVYIRLGDMEDDDEQRYVREAEMVQDGAQRFSQSTGLVSWASAIFLTSVLEYVAEQVLRIAGQTALDRAEAKARIAASPLGTPAHSAEATVEDFDMERVALSSGLGRLWRKWRKAQRNTLSAVNSPRTPIDRGARRRGSISDTPGSFFSPRRSSFGTALESPESRRESLDTARESPDYDNEESQPKYTEDVVAANIPLPLEDHRRDIDEIEVPGLAKDPDDPETTVAHKTAPGPRRNSFAGQFLSWTNLPLFAAKGADNIPSAEPERPKFSRQRSHSLPAPFRMASAKQQSEDIAPVNEAQGTEEAPEERPEQKADAAAMASVKRRASTENKPEPEAPMLTQQKTEVQADDTRGVVSGVVAGATAVVAAAAATIFPGINKEMEESEPQVGSEPQDDEIAGERNDISEEKSPDPESTALQTPVHQIESEESSAVVNRTTAIHLATDEIGVARTSDISLPSPTAGVLEADHSLPTGNARITGERKTSTRRPAQLVLSNTSKDSLPSPVSRVSPLSQPEGQISPAIPIESPESHPIPVSPRSAHFDSLPSSSHDEQTSFYANVLLDGAQRSPNLEPSPFQPQISSVHDQSSERSSSARTPTAPESGSAVQEHPVIQRIASLKGNESRYKIEEVAQPLTSASIKGPEDFEMFVQGGDTVKYTLTPENVRDQPVSSGLDLQAKIIDADQFQVTMSQPYARVPRKVDNKPSSPIVSSSPVDPRSLKQVFIPSTDPDSTSTAATRDFRQSVSRPSVRNTSVSRKGGFLAREPRVVTESTHDFADFIRSTGPDKEQQPVNLIATKSSTSLFAQKPTSPRVARSGSVGAASTRSLHRSGLHSSQVPPVPPVTNGKSRTSMQPRGATSASGDSAELIDFIRNGPHQEKEHRISRSVAPFRSTMDSDQLNEWSDQLMSQPDFVLAAGEPNPLSKQSTSSIMSSNQASTNSRSVLLNNAIAIEMPTETALSSLGVIEDEQPRRSRRPQDLSAIPLDEDDDDDFVTQPTTTRNRESLMDFLRDTEPPHDNAPKPISAANGTTHRGSVKTGAGTVDVDILTTGRTKTLPGLQIATATRAQSINTGSVPSGPRNRLEARSPGTSDRDASRINAIHGGTGDLADFFRNSGPPDAGVRDNFNSAPAPGIGSPSRQKPEKERNGRKPLFGGGLFARGAKKP